MINLGYKMNVFILAVEFLCYSGNLLSGIIARNIHRMKHKTKINKMFLGYFIIDCVIGLINTFFLFKLFRERLDLQSTIKIIKLKYYAEDLMVLRHKSKTVSISCPVG